MAKNQIVSIDIGTSAIKLVQLEQTAAGIRLVNVGIEAYPYTAPTTEVPIEVISEALQRVWRGVGGRSTSVALSIPRLLVTSRRLTNLPAAATDDQLSNLVAIQAETELPFRVEGAIYDHHDVHRSEDGISVELIAARREAVQQQIDYLKPLGITPRGVMPSTLATSALAGIANHKDDSSTGMTMVVDIGAGRTDLCLLAEEALRFSRSFPIGGNHLTHLYQQEMGSDFEIAERRKIMDAALNQHLQASNPSYEWADGLVVELKRSINGAKRDLNLDGDRIVSKIWLCGGGARVSGLADYIADRLEVPVLLWNPLDAFKEVWDEQRSDSQSVDSFSDTLAVALGLGVNALTSQISLDLLPSEEKVKLTQAQQRKRTLMAVAAGLVLLVGLGLGALTQSRIHQAKIVALDGAIRNISQAESNAKRTLTKDLAIVNLLAPRVSPLDIVRELSVRFSDRTKVAWTGLNITRLDDLERAKITFNIEAQSHPDVSQTISTMAQSGAFTNIKSGQVTSIERDKKPIFQAQITCNLSKDAIHQFAQTRDLNHNLSRKTESSSQKSAFLEKKKVGK
ncbi:type IV pilus assembly protein PilM [Candidatus Poribacteria bacterium]|nr:type IV pilus assembly protein PilM [Candidatus Poribacteria bacterium]